MSTPDQISTYIMALVKEHGAGANAILQEQVRQNLPIAIAALKARNDYRKNRAAGDVVYDSLAKKARNLDAQADFHDQTVKIRSKKSR